MQQRDLKNIVIDLLRNGHTVKLRATGFSMVPTLWPYMNLIARPPVSSELSCGDVVLFNSEKDALIAHRIVKVGNNSMLIQGDSCICQDGWINNDEIVGKVIGAEVFGIKLSMTWSGFRIYTRLMLSSSPMSHKANNILATAIYNAINLKNKLIGK